VAAADGVDDDRRPGRAIGVVRESACRAGIRLDDRLVPARDERANAVRYDADAALAILGFARNSDAHQRSSRSMQRSRHCSERASRPLRRAM